MPDTPETPQDIAKRQLKLYNELRENGYELPPFEKFANAMQDHITRLNFYNELTNSGEFELPDFAEFSSKIAAPKDFKSGVVKFAEAVAQSPVGQAVQQASKTMGEAVQELAPGNEAAAGLKLLRGTAELALSPFSAFDPIFKAIPDLTEKYIGRRLDPMTVINAVGQAFKVDAETAARMIEHTPEILANIATGNLGSEESLDMFKRAAIGSGRDSQFVQEAGKLGELVGQGLTFAAGGEAIAGARTAVRGEPAPPIGTEYQTPKEYYGVTLEPDEAKQAVIRLRRELHDEITKSVLEGTPRDEAKIDRIQRTIQGIKATYPDVFKVPKAGEKGAPAPADVTGVAPGAPPAKGEPTTAEEAAAKEVPEPSTTTEGAIAAGKKIANKPEVISSRWNEYKTQAGSYIQDIANADNIRDPKERTSARQDLIAKYMRAQLIKEEVSTALGSDRLHTLTDGEIEYRLGQRLSSPGGTAPRMTDDQVIEALQGMTRADGSRAFSDWNIANMDGEMRRYFATGGREGAYPSGTLGLNKAIFDAASWLAFRMEQLGGKLDQAISEIADTDIGRDLPTGDIEKAVTWAKFLSGMREKLKGTQVVDNNGTPKIVYHSTQAGFVGDYDILYKEEIGPHFGTLGQANVRLGIPNIDESKIGDFLNDWGAVYAKLGREFSPAVIPQFIDIQNPIRLPDLGSWDVENLARHLATPPSKHEYAEFGDYVEPPSLSKPARDRISLIVSQIPITQLAIHAKYKNIEMVGRAAMESTRPDAANYWPKELSDLGIKFGSEIDNFRDRLFEAEGKERHAQNRKWQREIYDILRSEGYDGIVYRNTGEQGTTFDFAKGKPTTVLPRDSYITFDQSQIISPWDASLKDEWNRALGDIKPPTDDLSGALFMAVFPDPRMLFTSGKEAVGAVADTFSKFLKASTYWIDPRFFTERKLGAGIPAEIVKQFNFRNLAEDIFLRQWLGTADKSAGDLRKYLNTKYDKQTLDNLMLSRGSPDSKAGLALKNNAIKALPAELKSKQMNKAINDMADFNYDYLVKTVGDQVGRAKDYFYGIYKDPAAVDTFLKYWQTTKRWTKQKEFPTYADAKAWGLELRNPNPVDNLLAEYRSIAFYSSMNALRDYAIKNGLARSTNTFTPDNFISINSNAFEGYRYDPDFARMTNSLLRSIPRGDITVPIRAINNIARYIKLGISTFHMNVIAKQAYADSKFSDFITGKPLKQIYESGIKGYDPVKEFGTDFHQRYINNGGSHRGSFEAEANDLLLKHSKDLEKFGALGATIKLPLNAMSTYTNWLFEDFIPKVKEAKTYQEWQRFIERNGREPNDVELQKIIREGQNFYGEMNESMFGRSGIASSILRIFFLAPGFGEGNYRAVVRGITQFPNLFKGTGDIRSLRNIPQSFALSAITAAVGTLIMTGNSPKFPDKPEDIRDLFKIDTGIKDEKGQKVMLDMMTYDRDYWNIWGNALMLKPGNIATTTLNRLRGMQAPTLEVANDILKLVRGEALVDWRQNKIVNVTDSNIQKIAKVISYESTRYLPISASQTYTAVKDRKLGLLSSAIESLAGVRPTYSEQDARDREAVRQMYDLRSDRERMASILYNSDNPVQVLKQYNSAVDDILNSDLVSPKVKVNWMKSRINIPQFIENQVNKLGDPKVPIEQKRKIVSLIAKIRTSSAGLK